MAGMPMPQASPGRPRSFDETAALERAMQVFWARGYPAASYPALEAATGLHRQSLRYAFGDKAALFRRAVEHYAAGRLDAVAALLRRPGRPALAGIEAVFDLWARDARTPRQGCLMVNSLAETGEARAAVAPVLEAANRRLLAALASAFRAAQAEGTIRGDADAALLAAQAIALNDGLILHVRATGRAPGAGPEPGALLHGFLALLRPDAAPQPAPPVAPPGGPRAARSRRAGAARPRGAPVS